MEWTFGIVTAGTDEYYVRKIIESIDHNNIPDDKYEIIIVGNTKKTGKNVKVIPFDEKIKFPRSWITRKKNIIAQSAKFQNMTLSHDYIMYDKDWYKNFVEFGDDWDVCMNRILNKDGWRFRDWTMWPPGFLEYDDISQTKDMYISGTYWCAKKDFMLKNPLDENLCRTESEDVEWSLRCRQHWKYRCNPKSIVQCLKQKEHNPQSYPHL